MRHSIKSQIFTGNYHDLLMVGTEGDEGQTHEEVLRIHDAKLAAMGTDSLTRNAIDAYRKKHFGTADPLTRGTVPPKQPPVATQPEKVSQSPPLQKAPSAAEQAKAAVERVIKPRDVGAAPEPTPTAPPVAEASAPDAPPAPTTAPPAAPAQKPDSFGLCEKCGEAVPESQAKLSRLFQNKTLCKKCMEAP
jgi:hypothetical protein